MAIITKSPLIERDLDLLRELQRTSGLGVTISIPLWDEAKARALEPSVATPRRRMLTIERLAAAGLEVGVNVAPLIPRLGDEDIVAMLTAARQAGARRGRHGLPAAAGIGRGGLHGAACGRPCP